jgi:hypothetical protein
MIEVRSRMEVTMRLLIPAAVSVSLVACVVEQDTSTSTQSVSTHNRIAANRIAANRIAANRIAANRIAANRIAANRLTLNTTADDLINTADGREVLDYIVSCAIPEGVTLVGTDSGGTSYEFNGEIGLVPDWEDHPLSESGAAWVSACLFSRCNNNDIAVDISMRGPSSALATDAAERALYASEEGAFYGMYFQPDSVPIATSPPWGPWFACSGRDNAEAAVDQRVCATQDPAHPDLTLCGFHYAGTCGNFTTNKHALGACESQTAAATGGYYEDCFQDARFDHHMHGEGRHDDAGDFGHGDHDEWHHDGGGGNWGHHMHGHQDDFDQVITTYVQ